MKRRYYIKYALLSLTVATLFSSCLKDDTRYVDFAGSKPLVELPAATGVAGTGMFQANSFAISTTPTPLNVLVNVAAPKPLTSPLTVKLSVDPTALTTYNTAKGTNYILLPAADYTSTLSVTIPANQNSANLVVNINTSLIDPSITTYVLPLTITDAGGQQISNYKTLLYNVQVKNKYDGDYKANGSIAFPPPTAGRTWTSRAKTLSTINANTVKTEGADLGGSGYYIYLTINADNTVTVKPSPDSANQTLQNNGPCSYDPTTKTFTLNYKYVGGTGDRVIVETIKAN
jgi:hypothetical protein